jgi:hypothetical protein
MITCSICPAETPDLQRAFDAIAPRRRAGRSESALERTDRRTCAAEDDDFFHESSLDDVTG